MSTARLSPHENPYSYIVGGIVTAILSTGGVASYLGSPGREELKAMKETQQQTLTAVQSMDRRLERLEEREATTWSRQEMVIWAQALKISNPTHTVPEVR